MIDLSVEDAQAVMERTREDPVWFIEEVLGNTLWGKQKEIAEAVRDYRTTAVASAHGTGKSFNAARIALQFGMAYPGSIVITTAPTSRQVKGILWKEIGVAHRDAKTPLGGKLSTMDLKWDRDWWIWGFTAPDYDPDRFVGFHAPRVLVIVDEAAGVSADIYGAIDGILSSEHAHLLMIGNPTDPTGEFGQAFKNKAKGTKLIYISAFDTPNFTTFGITEKDIEDDTWEKKITGPLPAPHLVTPVWVSEKFEKWGPKSPLYIAKVLGKFPENKEDGLIPLSWIEAAQNRELEPSAPVELGVDVGTGRGGDPTTVYVRRGPVVRRELKDNYIKTPAAERAVKRIAKDADAVATKIDGIGVGVGMVQHLEEDEDMTGQVVDVQAGASARNKEKFANLRAECYWGLRERFESGDIDIDPEDDDLAMQLAQIGYFLNTRGRIQIEDKDLTKKNIGHSPDEADAVKDAFAPYDDEDFSDMELGDLGERKSHWR